MPLHPELNPQEKISVVDGINDRMKQGETAFKALNDIRKLPKPIVVDFNNVLASNEPVVINPEAGTFLAQLRAIGDVIIVTNAENWQSVYELLKNGGAWSSDQVLMALSNWKFITSHERHSTEGNTLRAEYIQLTKTIGLNYSEDDLLKPPGWKRLAPIFGRVNEVPLIEDSMLATTNNPGMLGIKVKAFYHPATQERTESSGLSFDEAIQKIREFYSKL